MRTCRYSSQKKYSDFYRIPYLAFVLFIISMSISSYGQNVTQKTINDMAAQANSQIKGVDVGGATGRSVIAVGRNLMFQYDVIDGWQPYKGAKETLISSIKESGLGDFYYKESITVTYAYHTKNRPPTLITIKPHEFSSIIFELDEYISIKGHPKSKGVDLRIKPPKGWLVEEANGPNIVKKFTYKGATFSITTKDSDTFVTRSGYKERYSDESRIKDLAESSIPCTSGKLIDYGLVTVGLHPAVKVEVMCDEEIAGTKITYYSIAWGILYEDKFVLLMGMGNQTESEELKKLYTMVAVTTSFPEQFN